MISKVPVALKDCPYTIAIGHGIFDDISKCLKALDLGTDAAIVSHTKLERLHGRRLAASLKRNGYSVKFFNVPEGEQSKSAACALKLIEQISAHDVKRRLFVIALGGGVVGDLAGFVAAIYKRGIPYIQVPTTLLAQIDSAIGGKTAIDLKTGKNLVGAFYHPKLVFTDTAVLTTLNPRQIRNGLAEAIKYGIIYDPRLFKSIEENHALLFKGNRDVLNHIVKRCSAIKAEVVAKDPKEMQGLRTILNFGHTVGHAVEAAASYNQYHHGEAVGLGMRVAARISRELSMLSPEDEARINALISAVGLPKEIKGVTISKILEIMQHDKKFVAGRNRFVLAQHIGKVRVVEDVPLAVITSSIKAYSR